MKPKIKAAGVLPYSKDARGNTWFLLGREKPNQSWGVDSGSWSEFGGSIHAGETAEEGAAREFFEETMGAVFGNAAWMRAELMEGRYLLALDSKTPSGKGYRSFLKYVPFVDYPSKFARYKTMAKKFPHLLRELVPDCFDAHNGNMFQTCTEKTSMAWFSADQMKQAIAKYKRVRHQPAQPWRHNQSSYYEPGMVPHIRWGFAMDIDHLMNSSWGQNGFQNDAFHFPRTLSGEDSTTTFEIIKTASGTLRPIMKSPRFLGRDPITPYRKKNEASARVVPPIIMVQCDDEVKKKKRRRRRKKAGTPAESFTRCGKSSAWTVVTTKKKKRRKNSQQSPGYKPTPPVF
uniref:Nudix hydrolase domain-containing protein n=1 Tax=viral metagenome TaxID=1070528 RepID=A0A6C0BLJ1_9ZZZZ